MPTKYRYPVKRSPKSDPQQYRVYRMENEGIGVRSYLRLSKDTIRKLAVSVCRNYRVPTTRLAWADLGKWAAEWREQPSQRASLIVLNTKKGSARDPLTILHELAHHVHYWMADDGAPEQQAHGPEFMACYMSVLDTCRVIPVVGMRAICDAWRVQYADPGTDNSLATLQRIVNSK